MKLSGQICLKPVKRRHLYAVDPPFPVFFNHRQFDGSLDIILFGNILKPDDPLCRLCSLQNVPDSPFTVSKSVDQVGNFIAPCEKIYPAGEGSYPFDLVPLFCASSVR